MPSRSSTSLDEVLEHDLVQLTEQRLLRRLRTVEGPQSSHIRVNGSTLLNFSSNDYLGLANHTALKEAAVAAIDRSGVGSGASRLVCGSLAPHCVLEERLAAFKGTEAALTFSSGYAAAVGTITALVSKGDIIIIDKLIHASIVDAARLSGAKLRVFKHNDLEDLERILKWASSRPQGDGRARRILVVTESVFSMDGDLAPLADIVRVKDRYGAWLMVDEAHATGLFGERCSGLVEEFGLKGQVEVQLATLGKALGSAGGAVCGSRKLIDLLINRARSFVYSTAPTPAAAAAASKAIELISTSEGKARRDTVWALVDTLKSSLIAHGWSLPPLRSPIIPLIIGNSTDALAWSEHLYASGVFIPAIRFPTVARNSARLRMTMTAGHTVEDVATLVCKLGEVCTTLKSPANNA